MSNSSGLEHCKLKGCTIIVKEIFGKKEHVKSSHGSGFLRNSWNGTHIYRCNVLI